MGQIGNFLFGTLVGGVGKAALEKTVESAADAVSKGLKPLFEGPDRDDLLRVLLYLGPEVKELLDLFIEAERVGFIAEGNIRFKEEKFAKLLEKIDARHREEVFPLLNRILMHDRPCFFALMELLNENGWQQRLQEIDRLFQPTVAWLKTNNARMSQPRPRGWRRLFDV